MDIALSSGNWINKPSDYEVTESTVEITTEPNTDLWQRSYYSFRKDNAPAYLFTTDSNFTFTVKVAFDYKNLFDQCGVIIYMDSDNWFKASIEFGNDSFSRLGSVVTNDGQSDWATTDILLPSGIWYRLSRRGPDFLIEYSLDGEHFSQMRIFHLHALGKTSSEMGEADPPLSAGKAIPFGVYACSPDDSSFAARFCHFKFETCIWLAHNS
jgi:uncharacterized protein